MSGQKVQRLVTYAWISAAGTILAALAATTAIRMTQQTRRALSLVGNEWQAMGAALTADAYQGPAKTAGKLQAAGNTLVIKSLIAHRVETFVDHETAVVGNWLQALGSGYSLQPTFISNEYGLTAAFSVVSNVLQMIGNGLQGLSGTIFIRSAGEEEWATTINVTGSWLQATGAVIAYLSTKRAAFVTDISEGWTSGSDLM
ncbi:MAG: hypothetical protein ABF868_03105 [Sporolactobacillus sp.]